MYVVANGKGKRREANGTETTKELRYAGELSLCSQRSSLATFRCIRPTVMKPRNELAPRFAIMAQGKNCHFAKILPKSGHEQEAAYENSCLPCAGKHPRLLARLQNLARK